MERQARGDVSLFRGKCRQPFLPVVPSVEVSNVDAVLVMVVVRGHEEFADRLEGQCVQYEGYMNQRYIRGKLRFGLEHPRPRLAVR
jgi:hypothetical protein